MRRVAVTVIATVAALLAVPPAPAVAAVSVIDSVSEITDPFYVVTSTCSGGPGTVRLEGGPYGPPNPEFPEQQDKPPLGTGSLELDTSDNGVAGIARSVQALSGLATFDFSYHDPDGKTQAIIEVTVGDTFPETWTGYTNLPASSTWTSTINLVSLANNWVWYPPDQPGEAEVPTITSVEGFLSAYGDGPATATVQRLACGAEPTPGSTHIDALTLRMDAEPTTTFDFEAAPLEVTAEATPASILLGGSATISGRLSADDEARPGNTVYLQQSTNGFVDWTEAGSDVSDSNGNLSLSVSPTVTTQYRWALFVIDGPSAVSDPVTVTVKRKPALTITADQTTIVKGGTAVLRTRATYNGSPVSGAPVVLRRSIDGGTTWTDVATTTTNFNGNASANDQPTVDSSYRWHVLTSADYVAAMSVKRDITVMLVSALTLAVNPNLVDYGQTSTVTGTVTIDGTGTQGLPVDLYSSADGGTTWTRTASVVSGPGGALSQVVSTVVTRRYQWRYAGSAAHRASQSTAAVVTVRQRTSLTITATPRNLVPDQQTVVGTTFRADNAPASGATVHLDRSFDGGATWSRLVSRTTDANGAATVTFAPAASALYRWRFDRTPSRSPATSPTATITMSRPTALTIRALPASVLPGGTATITTKLGSSGVGVADKVVRLMASTDDGENWAEVATRTTDVNGIAEAQVTPSVETLYQWVFLGIGDYRPSESPTTRVTMAEPVQATDLSNELDTPGDDDQIYVGQRAWVRGRLTTGGNPRMNRTVILEKTSPGNTTWAQVATRNTDADGWVELAVTPTTSTRYRWRFAGAGPLSPTTSPEKLLTVSPVKSSSFYVETPTDVVEFRGNATLRAYLSAGSSRLAGAVVVLQRKSPTANSWTNVLSRTTNSVGEASADVPQESTTDYRWTYAGSETVHPSTSSSLRVQSKYAVHITVFDPPFSAGNALLVEGRVSPSTTDQVRLFRLTSGSPVEVKRADVRTTGYFEFSVVVNSGAQSYYVEIPGSASLLAGRSETRSFALP